MRPNVDPGAGRAVREHEVGDPDDGPVDGRVDVRAGCGADGERRGCQARRGPAAGTRRAGSRGLRRAGARCARRAAFPACRRGRVPENRRPRCGTRSQSRPSGRRGAGAAPLPARRDDLWQWLAARQHVGGRERLGGDRCRAPGAERGHEQGQHHDRRKEAARTKRVAWRSECRRRARARRNSLVARGRTAAGVGPKPCAAR